MSKVIDYENIILNGCEIEHTQSQDIKIDMTHEVYEECIQRSKKSKAAARSRKEAEVRSVPINGRIHNMGREWDKLNASLIVSWI